MCFSTVEDDVIEILEEEDNAERNRRRLQEAADLTLALQLEQQQLRLNNGNFVHVNPFPHLSGRERLDYEGRRAIDEWYDRVNIPGPREYGGYLPLDEERRQLADAITVSLGDAWSFDLTAVSYRYPEL